jgi:hypothetical protein
VKRGLKLFQHAFRAALRSNRESQQSRGREERATSATDLKCLEHIINTGRSLRNGCCA